MRRDRMHGLLKDVEAVIVHGDVEAVGTFSVNQVADERDKITFLDANPDLSEALFRLEDHPLLRGTLSVFEFDPSTFRSRASAFETLFSDSAHWLQLTGALLATGEYQRQRATSSAWQFGTASQENEAVWRELLTGATRSALSATRAALGRFLDGLAESGEDTAAYYKGTMESWLSAREDHQEFDWRYYLVKYPSMRGGAAGREGATGMYYGEAGRLGYSMCMLRTQTVWGYHRDPILLEVWQSSNVGNRVRDPWFMGYETNPRWLTLERSGIGIRCVAGGFAIREPEDANLREIFDEVCAVQFEIEATNGYRLLKIPQRDRGTGPVDTADRVRIGAALLRRLAEAGL